jgi:hypothetical protein
MSRYASIVRDMLTSVQPRLEGKVEIRPGVGVTAPVHVSMVTIHLQRREMINPTADSIIRSQVSSQRREITDMVGRQMCLYKVPPGRDAEAILLMDLPFMVFIPFGRGGEEVARRVPPASLQLDKRTAETFYELVVELRNGSEIRKYAFPVPISRYDTLSTFGMYNRPESAERTTDHIVTLGISLPRWSYGPLDPVSVYIKLSPNADWMSKAKRVTIQSITVGIEEEPTRKTKVLAKHNQTVGVRMPEAGYFTNLGLVFPARELRDSDGILPRGKKEFPTYAVSGFTTTGTLYKIEYYLTVKVRKPIASYHILANNSRRPSCHPPATFSSDSPSSYVPLITPDAKKKWKPLSKPPKMRLMSVRIILCYRQSRSSK